MSEINEVLQITPDIISSYGVWENPLCYFYMAEGSISYLKSKGVDPGILAYLGKTSGYWYFTSTNIDGQFSTRFGTEDTITGRANLFVNGFRVPPHTTEGVLIDSYTLEERKLFFYILSELFDNKAVMNRIMVQNMLMNNPQDLRPTLRLHLPGYSGDFNITQHQTTKIAGFNNYSTFSMSYTLKNIIFDHIPAVELSDPHSYMARLASNKIVDVSKGTDKELASPKDAPLTKVKGGFI